MKLPRMLAAVFLTACLAAATAFAGDPTGTWKWTMPGRDGQTIESTLKLELKDGQLTGSLAGRMGEAAISDASFKDDEVKFTVTRERNGRSFTVTYAGKLADDAITGTAQLPAFGGGGEGRTVEWRATRAK